MIDAKAGPTGIAGRLVEHIDPRSPIPLYYQLALALEGAIERGDLTPGSRLDNEVELARALALSRPTVRQALGYLVDRGRLVRRRGIGTIVLPAGVHRPVGLTSLFNDLVKAGHVPATRVLGLEIQRCPEDVADGLGIEPGAEITWLHRLRSVDDEPLCVMENYLPAALLVVDRAELERTGLYRVLAAAGIVPRVASQSVTARAASPQEAERLQLAVGAPLLALRRISYDAGGRAIELARHAYVGERYAIDMSLHSDDR